MFLNRFSVYSVFDSALYRKHTVKWLFLSRVPNERTLLVGVEVKATFDAISMSTSESKTL
jgi:hypothetical protein